jgi:glycosyltransferase involved in cell wall biosynthesis
MKIAVIAPPLERVPPRKYGGTERVVYELVEGLVRKGHDVTLFASADSITSAKLSSLYDTSLREQNIKEPSLTACILAHLGVAFDRQAEFDIIHDHNIYVSVPTAHLATTPTIVTLHYSFDKFNQELFQHLRRPHYVAISHSQATALPGLPIDAVIHNGLSMEHYPFSEQHDGYLLYVGRMSEQKGPHLAIEVAKRLNLPLIMAAKVNANERKFFKEKIKPHLGDQIQWIGEVDEKKRNKLMAKAMCLLHPVLWPEPFGLTLIEAMACGAPVVAFGRGSIPEIIQNGKTGYVVHDTDQMVAAVQRIDVISRKECREHALQNFSAKKMVDAYEKLYTEIIEKKVEAKVYEPISESLRSFTELGRNDAKSPLGPRTADNKGA